MFSDRKENWFTNVGNERVYGEIEALEESIWVLETSLKFVSGKGSEPCISRKLKEKLIAFSMHWKWLIFFFLCEV